MEEIQDVSMTRNQRYHALHREERLAKAAEKYKNNPEVIAKREERERKKAERDAEKAAKKEADRLLKENDIYEQAAVKRYGLKKVENDNPFEGRYKAELDKIDKEEADQLSKVKTRKPGETKADGATRASGEVQNIKAEFEQKTATLYQQIAILNQTVQSLQEKVNTISVCSNNTMNHSTITNTQNSNNVFVLNDFGKNDIDFLTQDDILEFSDPSIRYNKVLALLVKKINCNKSAPQNHNILITNLLTFRYGTSLFRRELDNDV